MKTKIDSSHDRQYLRRWIAHFESNRLNRPEPEWDAPFAMEDAKRHLLADSLAEYQLGDGGGPCQLIARDAETFCGASEDNHRAVQMWFAEEAEHSRLLAGALRRVGGAFIETTPAFRLFCWVRQKIGVQFEMLVLLLVEIVSTGYYRVIRKHVADRPIEDMCKLILRDEARHIDFHRDRLAARFPLGVGWLWRLHFKIMGLACAAFLWLGHGKCLRALGATWSEFLHHVTSGMENLLREVAQLTAPHKAAQDLVAPAFHDPNPAHR